MGLRLDESVRFDRIRGETGQGLYDWLDNAAVTRLQQAGYVTVSHEGIAATQDGRIRLASMLDYLMQGIRTRNPVGTPA